MAGEKLKIGDTVEHWRGSLPMTITDINNGLCTCEFWEEALDGRKTAVYPAEALRLWKLGAGHTNYIHTQDPP